jgi:hypothetical protein
MKEQNQTGGPGRDQGQSHKDASQQNSPQRQSQGSGRNAKELSIEEAMKLGR